MQCKVNSSCCACCFLNLFFTHKILPTLKYMALFLYLPLGNLITGGSLTKIAYYSTVPYRKVLYNKDQKTVDSEVYAELILNNQIQRQFVSEQFFFVDLSGSGSQPKIWSISGRQTALCQVWDQVHWSLSGLPATESGRFSRRDEGEKNQSNWRWCLQICWPPSGKTRTYVRPSHWRSTVYNLFSFSLAICNRVDKEEEMTCLIEGCNFLLKNIHDEVFIYQRHGNPEYRFPNVDPCIFPYLLVNIGSGVSIMKVHSDVKISLRFKWVLSVRPFPLLQTGGVGRSIWTDRWNGNGRRNFLGLGFASYQS